ncbi:MAG: spermidine synthase [Thiovulaceae bacterium]|nr:spermidine synthase [Sulfurimonadaceae bacterium]
MANSYTYNEMLVHTPVCTHKDPKNVLIFSDDQAGIKKENARHSEMNFTVMASKDAVDTVSNTADDAFDIIIFDTIIEGDTAFFAHLNRATTSEALVVFKSNAVLSDTQNVRQLFDNLGTYFKIVMPYTFDADEKGTTKATLIFASKFYHPTADFILHRTDLIDGLSYYNCDVHPAVFAQPNDVRVALKGVARN